MTTLSSTLDAIRQRLTENASRGLLDDPALTMAVQQAVERYSKDRPREMASDVAGSGSRYYQTAGLLTSWVRGFSSILEIEYPARNPAANAEPAYLASNQYTLYIAPPDTEYLYFVSISPSVGESFRVFYTGMHAHTDAQDTIYASDYNAFLSLACGMACQFLATRFAQAEAPTIAADSVDHQTKQQRYKDQASAWFSLYEQHIGGVAVDAQQGGRRSAGGGSGGGGQAATVVVSWERLHGTGIHRS